jgi:hypothetical protein
MKINNIIFHQVASLLFLFISGCSTAYQVTSNASEDNRYTITTEAFTERVCGKYVTIMFDDTDQVIRGTILSVHDSCISITNNLDTLNIPMQEVRFVSVKHNLLGAIIGLPLGILTGGLIGYGVGEASSGALSHSDEVLGSIGGLVLGSFVGAIIGPITGAIVCPTTTYELGSENEIYEEEHAP